MRIRFAYLLAIYFLLLAFIAIGLFWSSKHEDPEIRRAAVPVFLDMLKVAFGTLSALLGAIVVLITGVERE